VEVRSGFKDGFLAIYFIVLIIVCSYFNGWYNLLILITHNFLTIEVLLFSLKMHDALRCHEKPKLKKNFYETRHYIISVFLEAEKTSGLNFSTTLFSFPHAPYKKKKCL